jgi:hypothetical protein
MSIVSVTSLDERSSEPEGADPEALITARPRSGLDAAESRCADETPRTRGRRVIRRPSDWPNLNPARPACPGSTPQVLTKDSGRGLAGERTNFYDGRKSHHRSDDTNRDSLSSHSTSLSDIMQEVYIDKIRFWNVPLNITSYARLGLKGLYPGAPGKIPIDGDTLFIRINKIGSGAATFTPVKASLEFNPSRLVYPNPRDGHIHGDQLEDLLRVAIPCLFRKLGQAVDLFDHGVGVCQLHIARDHRLPPQLDVEAFLKELGEIRSDARQRATLWRPRGDDGQWSTLAVSTRTSPWRMSAYDRSKVHEGCDGLRTELQLSKGRANGWDFRRADDITSASVTELLGKLFNHVKFGEPTSLGRLDLLCGELVPCA